MTKIVNNVSAEGQIRPTNVVCQPTIRKLLEVASWTRGLL